MAINRIQFQPGLSMMEFFDRYGQPEQCEAALAAARWPEGFRPQSPSVTASLVHVRRRLVQMSQA